MSFEQRYKCVVCKSEFTAGHYADVMQTTGTRVKCCGEAARWQQTQSGNAMTQQRTIQVNKMTYMIQRFSVDKPTKIIAKGLSLKEAKLHCSREDTHKFGKDGHIVWFDGYSKE